MELEPDTNFKPIADRRPRIPEPPPVKLLVVDDVTLSAPTGLETRLDEFYSALLQFERDPQPEPIAYHAENFIVRFVLSEVPPLRDDYRPLRIQVKSLDEAQDKLQRAEIGYARRRGVALGEQVLVLLDPAGNWVELVEMRVIV